MKILIIHEIDWINKVPFEPQHFAELFSMKGHQIFVIDCGQPNLQNFHTGLHTSKIENFHSIYDESHITLIRPSSILLKGLNRLTHFVSCERIIQKTIVENNIDVILLYGVATNGIQTIKIAKKMNIPVVFRALDVAHKLVHIPFLNNLVKFYEKNVICNATKVLTTTPDMALYAKKMGAHDENVEFFPLGINSNNFKPVSKDKVLAQQLGISSKDRVIVFVGTIYTFAGLNVLVQKFNLLKQKIPYVKLLIVGGGPYFNELKSLIEKNKLNSDIILTGFKPQFDIPKYISLADICITPFVINGITDNIMPVKIIEYLACGKPVLSTPMKGTVKLFPDETFGIFYSNLENFINTLSDLLNNPMILENAGKNGNLHVKENYDMNALSEQILKKFSNLILNDKNY
jgi:glycosyltransferase involved in cell wall biosynthesis